MSSSNGVIRRRVLPSVPLALSLPEEGGGSLDLSLRLAWDFNAMALAEEQTGRSLLDGEAWRHLSGSVVSVLFWASLQAYQPQYAGPDGLAAARSYMDAGNAARITEAVIEAFTLSLPDEQRAAIRAGLREPEAARPTPAASPGSTSGPSPDTTSAFPMTNSAA